MVSVVIPAFDEVDTVGASAGARVVRLERNGGKAEALDAGVRAARHDVILFLDADVIGHTDDTLSRIMQPVIDGRYEMYVGIHAQHAVAESTAALLPDHWR